MRTSGNTSLNGFWKIIRFLIEPPPSIADIQQRHRSRLLSALLLIIIVLGGLSGTVQVLTIPGFFPTFIAILGAIIVLCVAYLLARTKYYLVAATLSALTPFMASYTALLQNTEDQSAFVFMIMSVLISSMLLNRWLTLCVAFLNLLGLLLLPWVQPAWTFATVSGKVSFHIMTSALILIAMGHRDLIERDRQKELAESELKFRSIFDHSVDAIGVSRNGIHVMVNPAYVRMFGHVSADSLVGSSILDLIAPSERSKIQEYIRRRSIGEDLPIIYETRGLRRDGIEFDMEVHVSNYELRGEQYTVPIVRDITERKQAENKLYISEQKFAKTFRASPDSVTLSELESGRLVEVNDGFQKVFGYSREEAIGHSTVELGLYQTLVDRQMMVQILRDQGSISNLELKGLHKSGAELTVLLSVELIEIGGRPHLVTITRDITDSKEAEEALRLSEGRYHTLAQNLPDSALLLFDQELRFIIADGPEIKATGFSREMLEGKTLHEALPREFAQIVEPNMRRALAGEKFYAEIPYEDRFYRYSYVPLRDGAGNVVMGMILATNITERKRSESLLRLRLSLFEYAAQHSLGELLQKTLDEAGELIGSPIGFYHFVDANEKSLSLQAWSTRTLQEFCRAEGRGMHYSIEKAGVWVDCVRERRPMIHNDYASLPHRKGLPEGHANLARELVVPVLRNDHIVAILGLGNKPWDYTNQDVEIATYVADVAWELAERKHAEEEREKLINELEAKNSELERFTYTVSHDLKAPLVTIKGFLGFVQQDVVSGNILRLNNDLERIGNATKKMERLLWDLLELSRIGRLVKPPEEVPFDDLVSEASEIVHGQLDAHGVTVRVQPDLPAVYGDRQRLIEVFQNLLDNAAKYMGDQTDPLIEIGLQGREDNKYLYYVRDNGIGIEPQHHERVFGLFNKLDARSEGTGVGLALVKRIIEFHDGRIWIESEGDNRGTTIRFTLPSPPGTLMRGE